MCSDQTLEEEPMADPRNVLITGGNRGIGLSIARAFVQAGDNVVLTHRSGEVPEGLKGVICEVTDSESVDAAFTAAEEKLGGPIEVLVANAGITRDGMLMRMSDEDFDSVIDTNLAGAFRCARRASKGMIRLRRGRIVFISSVVGLYGSAGQANYSASKSALVGLARSISRELGGRGITANVVAPGFVETEMTAELPQDRKETYLAGIPAGRFAGANRSVSGLPRKIAFAGFGHHRRHEGHQDADRLDLRTSNRPTEIAQAARQYQVGKEFELVVGKRTNAAIAFQVAVTARFQSTTDLQR